jgi:hypothetical protein
MTSPEKPYTQPDYAQCSGCGNSGGRIAEESGAMVTDTTQIGGGQEIVVLMLRQAQHEEFELLPHPEPVEG